MSLDHYLTKLKYRQTGSDPQYNGYAYAEVPDWALRQAITEVDRYRRALEQIASATVYPPDGFTPEATEFMSDLYFASWARSIAREALDTPKTDGSTDEPGGTP